MSDIVEQHPSYSHRDLSQVVTLVRPGGDEEKRTVKWCLEHGFVEIKPEVWTGFWHSDHPAFRNPSQVPDLLKRNLESATSEEATSVTSSDVGSHVDGTDVTQSDPLSTGTTMFLRNETDNVSLRAALEALRQARGLLDAAQDIDEPWQHPQEVLDATAAALDEGALAIRSLEESKRELEAKEEDMVHQVEKLSNEVKVGRSGLLMAQAASKLGPSPELLDTEENSTILVVYATQTGTARKFAKRLKRKLGAVMMNICDVTPADVACRKRVYFIVSTFGLGRPPCPAEMFFASLQLLQAPSTEEDQNKPRRLPFARTEVAVAALGNSTFKEFAAFGKALVQELSSLGAKELAPMQTLDANGNQKEEFIGWMHQVMELEGVSPDKVPKKTVASDAARKAVDCSCSCAIM